MNLDSTTYRKDKKYPIVVGQRARGYGRAVRNKAGVLVWSDSGVRDTARIKTLLIHTTNGNGTNYIPEAVFLRDSWDVSSGYVVSSHDATVVQLLDDSMIAWHSGDCVDNDFENASSIGIEIAWTTNRGPLPQQAITNVSELVLYLLNKYPSIEKIDTHRAQAVPAGRKVDPSGWSDAAFYAWRDRILQQRKQEDIWSLWSTEFPLGIEQRAYGIPQLWKENARWLGAARSGEIELDSDTIIQSFTGGWIVYKKSAGVAHVYKRF